MNTLKIVAVTALFSAIGLLVSRELVSALVNTASEYGVQDLYVLGTGIITGTLFITMVVVFTSKLRDAIGWILAYSLLSWVLLSATIVAASFMDGMRFALVLPVCGTALPLLIGMGFAAFYEEE